MSDNRYNEAKIKSRTIENYRRLIMDNFTFYSPTYFLFGKDTEKQTGEYVKKYGGHKVLIHYGGGSVRDPDFSTASRHRSTKQELNM